MLTWHTIWIIVRKVSYIFDEWWSARSSINMRIKLFLNAKPNAVLVLTCNVDLAQHSNHCKKSFLYNSRMMNGELSYQLSYHCSYKNLNVDCRLMIIALTSHTVKTTQWQYIYGQHDLNMPEPVWSARTTMRYNILWQLFISILKTLLSTDDDNGVNDINNKILSSSRHQVIIILRSNSAVHSPVKSIIYTPYTQIMLTQILILSHVDLICSYALLNNVSRKIPHSVYSNGELEYIFNFYQENF